jgi:predicted secreted protein
VFRGDLYPGDIRSSRRIFMSALLTRARTHLEDTLRRLELIRSSSAICVSALRHQNCEIDEDVAIVMQRNVADKVGEEIEKLSQLLEALEPEPTDS